MAIEKCNECKGYHHICGNPKRAIEVEWKKIHTFRPTLHFCPDNDYNLIEEGMKPFDRCLCYRIPQGVIK